MKRNCIYIFIFLNFVFHLNTLFATQQSNIEFKFYYSDSSVNPLAAYSSEWTRSDYENCNTAKDISYLSSEEKKVLAIALADDKAAHEVEAALAARAAGHSAAPLSRNAKARITVALADDKAGHELIAKIQG